MGDYIKIANSNVFYICAIVITLAVLLQAYIFIRISLKEGEKRGLSKKKMYQALRTGAVTSIVPSISTVVALIAMIPVLGLPIPWIRQSIMGSTLYELTAAGVGAKAMGVIKLGGPEYTASVFASSIWIMTLGSFWAVAIVVFFLKKYQSKITTISGGDPAWKNILINAAFFGVFSIFIADPVTSVTTDRLPLTTLIAGGFLMTIFGIIIVKLKQKWLREFALTFSMIGAMVVAALASHLHF